MKRSIYIQSIVFPSIGGLLILGLGLAALFLEVCQPPFSFFKGFCFLVSFILYSLMCVSYYKAVFVSPGFVPDGWTPNLPEIQLEYAKERYRISVLKQQKLIDMLYPAQYCGDCQSYRPPRSYHCKSCGKCVLKRDHHCPWIGQCVGFGNYKYFIQFLWYAPIILFLGVLWHCYGLYSSYLLKYSQNDSSDLFDDFYFPFRLGCCILDFALSVAIGGLAATHTYHMLINTTGQEQIELSYLRKNGSTQLKRSIYSKTIKENFFEVMGSKWYDWFLPTPPLGDGIHFIKKIDIDV